MNRTPRFWAGLDIGQRQDYTALTLSERVEGGGRVEGGARPRYHVRHLQRFELGTKYPAVVERVTDLMARVRRSGPAELTVDATGVGLPVVEMFTEAGLNPTSVLIHGGDTVSRGRPKEFRVPKRALVSRMQALLQSGRLKFAAGLPHLETLKEELSTFRAKINLDTGHASFEHWRARDHDDLVLALAISLWRAERWTPAPELPPSLSC